MWRLIQIDLEGPWGKSTRVSLGLFNDHSEALAELDKYRAKREKGDRYVQALVEA